MGVDPVASPSTVRWPAIVFSRMSVAMRDATRRAMSAWSSTTIVRIFSSCVAAWEATREGPRDIASRASSAAPASMRTPETVLLIGRSGGEGAAAAASTRRVRVLEGEPGALHRRHVVVGHAAQVLRGERVDEDLELAHREDGVVLGG